jgi:hypothetical protein
VGRSLRDFSFVGEGTVGVADRLGVAGVPGAAAVGGVTGSATVTLAIASFTAWLSFATSAAKSWPLSALSAALSR